MKKILFAWVSTLCLGACAVQNGAAKSDNLPTPPCANRVCTMNYQPVCATVEEGKKIRRQTFSNRCGVCSDNGKIIKIDDGACAAEGL